MKVSIPLEQGRVFRHKDFLNMDIVKGLNPFRTGRGLSTLDPRIITEDVSIPLEQGRVFRLRGWFGALMDKA